IVLDNVDLGDGDLVLRELRSRLPREMRGHLLATTRHPSLADLRRFRETEVPPFSRNESVAFLKLRSHRESAWGTEEDRAAGALADRLGGLPLALEQAAAYVEVNCGNFVDYLREFTGIASLERRRPRGGQYPESVATTWRMNFERIERENPASANILRASAWLAPAPIPLRFVEQGAPHLGDGVEAALNAESGAAPALLTPLAQYSLIRRDRDGQTYWIHRLVAEVMRDRLGAEAAGWRDRALLALADSWPVIEFGDWPLCRRLLPHTLHLWATVPAGTWEDQPASLRLLNQCGVFLNSQGRYGEAEPLYARALAARERVLGAEHPDTLGSVNNLAGLYESQGRYGEAEPLYARALAGLERTLGREHPHTVTVRKNLARLRDR
ncbi:MAG: tetratricopeptide repeat protein, partial [Acidobacteria bacterium]|nr:tetratricopeptide repeat protein [Acidobacteriota bacterium]